MMNKIKLSDKAMAYIRLAVFALPLINGILMVIGWTPLPIDEYQLELGITMVLSVIGGAWGWWKNNNVTEKAQKADEYLDELKGKNKK